ncbi:MAG TPA: STAS domain-containing protein [Pirellulales bacterium]|nr:STAS domain-containing protein [Pirellulales bacterium]
MEMHIGASTDTLTRISLVGMFDMVAVDEFEGRLLAATAGRGKNTIIDLAKMSFIASLGMGVLEKAYKDLKHKGAKIVLLDPQPDVETALRAAHLQEILPIAHGEEEAQRLFAA